MSSTGGAMGIGSASKEVEDMTIQGLEKDSMSQDASSNASVINLEKGEIIQTVAKVDSHDKLRFGHEEQFPIDYDAPEETHQFTIRAVITGGVLGGVIAASNVYLGLKTGWTFGAALFGSILGFAILKPLSRALPEKFGGGYFGPKENVCVQSTATAAGSLGLIFTSGIPAAYQLGLLDTPSKDFGKLITLTFASAYYGMFFAIPLRKLFILKQKLTFPSGVAAAYTIQSLHVGKNAELNAKKKTRALIIAFILAITWRCVSEYAPGMLWDWHWGWTLYRLGWQNAIYAENWNWVFEFTPAFIGIGFLTGLNPSYSFFGGAVIAWGIIAPSLVTAGVAFGEAVSPKYPGYMNYMGMVLDDPVHHPSPRYWLVWPGTMLLLAGTFAEVFAQWKPIINGFLDAFRPFILRVFKRNVKVDQDALIEEPCQPHELVPFWMWGGGIVISILFTCLIMGLQWHLNVGQTLLTILFSFILAFIGAESTGRTNITPVTSCGNAVQLIIGGTNYGHGTVAKQQLMNLSAGLLAVGTSYQSADMLGDMKTTHLLRAAPRVQFYAQCCGAVVSIFMSAGMYLLFATAYPCINDLNLQAHCAFPAPDVGVFRAIAVAVTSSSLPVPRSSGILSLVFLVWAFVQTFIKYRFVPPKYHGWVPNLVAMGIAFILNTTTYPMAMATGATIAFVWNKRFPEAFAMYCYVVAAGMIAGEGLGGIVGAILQVSGVSGNYKGTAIGCPAMEYCG